MFALSQQNLAGIEKSWHRATVPVLTLGVCDHPHNTLWQGLAMRTTSPWHSQPGQTPSNPAKDPLWFQSTLDVSFPIWKQSLPDQLQGTSVGRCAKGFLVPGWAQWVLKSTTSYTLSVTFCQHLHFEAERKRRRDNPSQKCTKCAPLEHKDRLVLSY